MSMTAHISEAQWRSAHYRLYIARKEAAEQDQILEPQTSCSLCCAVLRLMKMRRSHRREIVVDVSTDHTHCQNHGVMLSSNATDAQIRLLKPAGQSFIYLHSMVESATKIPSSLGVPWEPFLIKNSQPPQTIEHNMPLSNSPRLVDREWIDIELLKKWHATCIGFHTYTCRNRNMEADSSLPKLLLIDTTRKCLVRMERSCRYVALSYVWGSTNAFLTIRKNISQLSQPQALAPEHVRLPKTIEQAIALTSALGEQYLWVDALCIVQDGPDKTDQLNAMASLFNNAILTIVAAQGSHADAGFRGLHGISEPRHAEQQIAPISPEQHLVRPSSKHIWNDTLLNPWSSRAWTFQEAMCSQRLLYFANNTVRWCCKLARWSEESHATDCVSVYAGVEPDQHRLLSPQLELHTLPVLSEFEALINSFNTRNLTYEQDVLIAFAGVATRLSDKFKGGLISGLPEIFFDICLLWRPLRRIGSFSRRRTGLLPSWSWAGWESEVTWPYTWNHTLDFAGPIPIMLGNTQPFYRIQFSYISAKGSAVPIAATWFNEAIEMMAQDSLPEWETDSVDNSVLHEWGLPHGEVEFKHVSDHSIRYCFPLPLSTSTTPSRVTSLLSFRTTSGNFKLGEVRKSIARIHRMDGRLAGTLWQHDEKDVDFLRAIAGPIEDRSSIQLIAILGCTTPRENDFIWTIPDVSALADSNNPNVRERTEEIYNVMWICRGENDIVYRKGTGIILRDVWEAEALDWSDITLG